MPRRGSSSRPAPQEPLLCIAKGNQGTTAGYGTHMRAKEQPCPPCRRANARGIKEWRAKKRRQAAEKEARLQYLREQRAKQKAEQEAADSVV